MTYKFDPLNWRVAIVDKAGNPTPEFMRKWEQQHTVNAAVPSSVAPGDVLANVGIVATTAKATTVTALLDYVFGTAQGNVIYRDATAWKALAPGALNTVLGAQGAAANPLWRTLTALLDAVFGSAQGDLLYRDAAAWKVLAPGTSGNFLQTQGAAANPQWAAAGTTFANPTATAGPAAVNGTATTAMRSDAAPAIQKASASQFGIVEVDGTSITAAAGVISAAGFVPLAAAFHPGYAAGRFYGPPTYDSGQTPAIATGTLYFTPFYCGVSTTFTKATVRWASAATANAEMGIYSNAGGQPSALLHDFGQVTGTTSGTNYTITGLTVALTPGWYWLAVSVSASVWLAGVAKAGPLSPGLLGCTINPTIYPTGYSQAWTYLANSLPAVGTLASVTNASTPTIFLSF